MANYYVRDGRYFGEDTSFYEYDGECLKKKEHENAAGNDVQESDHADPLPAPDSESSKKYDQPPAAECGACSCGSGDPESPADSPESFDRLFTNRKLDMLKTAIPFLPRRQQKSFACAVKLAEFQNLIGYFGQNQETLLGACSDESPQLRMANMLDALRSYCSPAEQEQIDSLFQVLMTVQMMREGL